MVIQLTILALYDIQIERTALQVKRELVLRSSQPTRTPNGERHLDRLQAKLLNLLIAKQSEEQRCGLLSQPADNLFELANATTSRD